MIPSMIALIPSPSRFPRGGFDETANPTSYTDMSKEEIWEPEVGSHANVTSVAATSRASKWWMYVQEIFSMGCDILSTTLVSSTNQSQEPQVWNCEMDGRCRFLCLVLYLSGNTNWQDEEARRGPFRSVRSRNSSSSGNFSVFMCPINNGRSGRVLTLDP